MEIKELVVDSNIIISILISPTGRTASVFLLLGVNMVAPASLLIEVESKRTKILRARKWTSENEFQELWNSLRARIQIISADKIHVHAKQRALAILEKVDADDVPFLALALDRNIPLWTGDKKLTIAMKDIHPCYSSRDLDEMFGLTTSL